eukprot:evm.model.scf_1083.3 EVM.evm.TU.scf_1083.3   scf_1083:38999-39340(-)
MVMGLAGYGIGVISLGKGNYCHITAMILSLVFEQFLLVCQDHFRRVVNPAFTSVYSEREKIFGVVEFDSADDLKYAIRKLDNTEFKNPFDRAYIRILDDSRGRSLSRSRSRSR